MPRCPYCFFAGAHFLPDGQLRCASCGKVYQQQLTYPQPPRNVAASPVPGGAGRAIIFVGAMVALVVSSAIVFALMADSEADQPWPEEPIYVAEPETRRAEPPQPARVEAVIGETSIDGINGTYPWWVLTCRNTGNVAIQHPTVRAEFYDDEGTHLGSADFGAYVYYLPPGETVWIYCSPTKLRTARRAAFTLLDPKPAGPYVRESRRLKVSNVQVVPQSSPALKDYPFLTGYLSNQTGANVYVGAIQAIGYDEDDAVCAYALGNPKNSNLKQNEHTEFKLNTGAFVLRKPVRWDVHAWGSVRD